MSVTTVPVTAMLTAQTLPPEVTHAHARLVLLGMDFHAKVSILDELYHTFISL